MATDLPKVYAAIRCGRVAEVATADLEDAVRALLDTREG